MQKWIINVVVLIMLILGIWNLFAPEKSKVSKGIAISLLALSSVIAILNNFHAFAKDPSSQQVGTLKPKYSRTYKDSDESYSGVGIDQNSQIFVVQMSNGVVFQPLGRYAPFSIRKKNDELLISVIIHSLDGKVIAKIIDNEWELNPNNYFRKNFDRSALEVIDEYDIPVLQVEYLDEKRIKIGGIFHLEEKEISEIYPDFPSTPREVNPRAIFSFRGVIMIIGEGGCSTYNPNITPQELHIKARGIKPWFDYSKPKRLGIRKDSKTSGGSH
jgi:hypothetical protein